jgi:hypothetical protein
MIRSGVVGIVTKLLVTGLEIEVPFLDSLQRIDIRLSWEASRPDLGSTQYFIQKELEKLR